MLLVKAKFLEASMCATGTQRGKDHVITKVKLLFLVFLLSIVFDRK